MSNPPQRSMGAMMRWIVMALVVFVLLFFPLAVVIVFPPVAIYFLWEYHDRIKELERRVQELSAGKPSEAPPPV